MRALWSGLFGLGIAAAPVVADAPENTACTTAQFIVDGETPGAVPAGAAGGVWYYYVSAEAGRVLVRLEGASQEAKLDIWSACPDTGEIVAHGTGVDAPAAAALLMAEAGVGYYLNIADAARDQGSFKITIVRLPDGPADDGGGGGGAPAGADIILTEAQGASSFGTVGGVNGYSIASYTCNIGDAPLAWVNAGTPVLFMNAYRLHNGRLTQIGIGHGKSACCVGNSNFCGLTCLSGPAGTLRPGCRDVYGAGFNAAQNKLAPRSAVNPFTGAVTAFPGTTGNAIWRRLQVAQSDLSSTNFPGAQYFIEGMYTCTDEVDGSSTAYNNASYERVLYNTSTQALTRQGATFAGSPAIKAWREHGAGPNTPDLSVHDVVIDVPGEGRFHAAYKVTNLANGRYLYDYAIENLNSHRAGGGLSVPLADGVTAGGVGFHDINYHSDEPYDNTDWSANVVPGAVKWLSPQKFEENANSNALRFATMYNFWFESTYPPADATLTLGLFRPGSPESVGFTASAPRFVAQGDMNCDGVVNFDDIDAYVYALNGEAGYETAYPSCRWMSADTDGNGAVDFDDIDSFVGCLIQSGCP